MDSRYNNAAAAMPSSSSASPSAASVSFPEENGIVLDKWLMDVCGEEELQFPSHRRVQYPAYLDRLRRVSKTKQFIANTFDYPSRSGTREILVLQKTLEALGLEERVVRQEIHQAQESITQMRAVLDERTMGASTIVEEERAQAAKLAEMKAEQQAKEAAAAAAAKTSAGAPSSSSLASPAPTSPAANTKATAPHGYAPLNAGTPVVVVTAPPLRQPPTQTSPSATSQPPAAARRTETPLPMPGTPKDDDDAPTANSSVSSRSTAGANASSSSRVGSGNTFSAVARAARRADYEKKKALSLRYIAEVEQQTQTVAAQRAERQARHTQLLQDKDQLDKEYAALQTTEALVVARHEEAEAHEHEETALLRDEAAAYAAEDAAFAAVWEEAEAAAEGTVSPAAASTAGNDAEDEEQKHAETNGDEEGDGEHESSRAGEDDNRAMATPPPSPPPPQQQQQQQRGVHHDDPESGVFPDSPITHPQNASSASHTAEVNTDASASVSLTPGERDKSPPEATLHTHRPPSQGSHSVASSSPSPSPVERVLHLANAHDESINDVPPQPQPQPQQQQKLQRVAAHSAAPPSPDSKEGRRALLEGLRHQLSDLGAATQACRRQLLNTSQTHIGRFRQSQQRLKDWQDMAAQLRATAHQLMGQVHVIRTALQDAANRLDKDTADAAHGSQLAKLNELLRERSYETFQYYMGSGEAAATDMMMDANAEEELRALHRPSPSAAAGGMTPIRGGGGGANGTNASVASSLTPTRENSVASAYHNSPGAHPADGSSSSSTQRGGVDAPSRHRSRYELVRHLQRWEAALLADRLAILKAAHMEVGPFSGAGANRRKAEGFNPTRCYQELRHLLIQQKHTSGGTTA